MKKYSMPGYFQNMPVIGEELYMSDSENERKLREIEAEIKQIRETALAAGRSDESLNDSGQMTAMQRILALVDEGTWCPLDSLFNPEANANGSTNIVKGLGCIGGKWAMIVASDNKKLAGAWVPGQSENLLRAADTAKVLRIPLIYLLNCSGVQFDVQEKVYPNRRGGGAPFYRNAELAQLGIPVLVGIYGTNPAGGGYHAISPTLLIAHKNANMAVGGVGILSGMSPKGYVDQEGALTMVEAQINAPKSAPPGSMSVHHEETGFVREVYDDDTGVINALKKYVSYLPAYDPEYFRVAEPAEPKFDAKDLYSVIPTDPKRFYDIYQILARIFDGSQFQEYKKGYGPEMITGLARLNGLLVGVVINRQDFLIDYPEYRGEDAMGVGGKLYRQGLIKMSEFVTLCARDRIPIIWFQDSSGIDVGDEAEKAELLGLGQSLIYSIQNSGIPQMEVTLRKGSAAAHYVLGGPQCERTNAFSLGTAACEYYVMNGETAASAMYVRRLVKEYKAGKPLDDTIALMNAMIEDYHVKSRPKFCAQMGIIDEVVDLTRLRSYCIAFTESAYQNPASVCPIHQMILPRCIREFDNLYRKDEE